MPIHSFLVFVDDLFLPLISQSVAPKSRAETRKAKKATRPRAKKSTTSLEKTPASSSKRRRVILKLPSPPGSDVADDDPRYRFSVAHPHYPFYGGIRQPRSQTAESIEPPGAQQETLEGNTRPAAEELDDTMDSDDEVAAALQLPRGVDKGKGRADTLPPLISKEIANMDLDAGDDVDMDDPGSPNSETPEPDTRGSPKPESSQVALDEGDKQERNKTKKRKHRKSSTSTASASAEPKRQKT